MEFQNKDGEKNVNSTPQNSGVNFAPNKPVPPRMAPPRMNIPQSPQNLNATQGPTVRPQVKEIQVETKVTPIEKQETKKQQKIYTNNDSEEDKEKDKSKSIKFWIIVLSAVLIAGLGVFIYFIAIGSIFNFSTATKMNVVVVSDNFTATVYDNENNDISLNTIAVQKGDETIFKFTINNNLPDSFVIRMKYNPIGDSKYDPSYCALTLNNFNNYMYYYDGYYYYKQTLDANSSLTINGIIKFTCQTEELKRKELVSQFVIEQMKFDDFKTAVLTNSLTNNFGSAPLEWKQIIVGE